MNISELEKERELVLERIYKLPLFRPGTLTSRYRRCGKINCHCANEGSKGHGPSWTITRKVKGKTVAKYIRREMLDETKKQIKYYNQFHDAINDLIEINVKLCDAQLKKETEASKEAKKNWAKLKNQECHRAGSLRFNR